MTEFSKLPIDITVPVIDTSVWRLAQQADVPERRRYKYTEWEEEIAPPTPLLVYAAPKEYADQIISQLPAAITDKEVPGVYFIKMEKPHKDSTVPPHVDVGRRTAINIYLECAGETTEFFKPDEESKKLHSTGKFVAQRGDVWLLDVTKPHAVRMSSASVRSVLSLSFRRLRADVIEQLMKDV